MAGLIYVCVCVASVPTMITMSVLTIMLMMAMNLAMVVILGTAAEMA